VNMQALHSKNTAHAHAVRSAARRDNQQD
jgi:hypothetical protein